MIVIATAAAAVAITILWIAAALTHGLPLNVLWDRDLLMAHSRSL